MSIVHYVSKKGKRKSNEDNHSIYSYLEKYNPISNANADANANPNANANANANANPNPNPNVNPNVNPNMNMNLQQSLNASVQQNFLNSNSKPNINFYGVYDGHGGKFVSSYLSKNLPPCFIHPKVVYPLSKSYVNNIYDKIEEVLYTKHEKESMDCGSTCLVVCHYKLDGKEYIDVMNTGDSRLVGCNQSFTAVQITLDHKPYTPLERRRLEKLGAKVGKEIWNDRGDWRINDLSVSRAFGDKSSEQYVISRPDMFTHKVTDNLRFIILACDGLWDVVSNQEAVDLVIDCCYDKDLNRIDNPKHIVNNEEKYLNIAEKLACMAIDERGSTDNVTAIVVFFD